jgi:hypothetical protein
MKTARRGFLKSLAVAPLAPAALAPQAAPPLAPKGNEAVAEALAEAAKREFGAHLDPADLEAVKKELTRNLDDAGRLRAAAGLRNADGPVNLFTARPPALPERGGRR